MSRLSLLSALTLWPVAGITFVGCGGETQSVSESSLNPNSKTKMPVEDDEQSQNYVMCRATLTAWTRDYAWFDDSSFGHDDGVAPLASFVIVEPSTHTERDMDILFKYAEDAATTSLLGAADIGRQFTVQIPRDFLTGNSKIIDNASVRHLRKLEP